ncbi:DUF7344 domain-containing protein [Natronorubrum daqingense]|uniref:DUF7344 domain-containing protein n=1 Tax=Natronorubrum daqingense TaxID=588898 RepID=A0A1N6ZT87_9EURY|nr:hypothetical protein BB347_00795 [Natronorubrum daqingense]SIR29995.1 hypothetical protein SAMN05421809_0905 [Natronorubrum daqingense]
MTQVHDNLFEVLSNVQRRRILFTLVEGSETVNLDSPPDSFDERTRSTIEQQHVHLPKLADYGFIEWHERDRLVEKGPRFDEIEPLLQYLLSQQDSLLLERV